MQYLLVIFILLAAFPALAVVPVTCRNELDETYGAADEASLDAALQNLGLCLELELYPKDVKKFLKREATCIRIAGEEPGSGDRAIELDRLNKANNCDSTQEEKEALLKKYRKDAVIVRALHSYGNKVYPGGSDTEPDQPEQPDNQPESAPSNGGVI